MTAVAVKKTWVMPQSDGGKSEVVCNRYMVPQCDGQTDGRTAETIPLSVERDKNK